MTTMTMTCSPAADSRSRFSYSRRPNNVWRHEKWRAPAFQRDSCSCSNSIPENKTSRFNLKMRKRNRLFTDKASHINWLMHRLMSLPPPVHLLGLSLPATATATQIIDY